jgi:hypothetical protein
MKLDPRAYIGYLVGYDSTNIYRVWVPHKGTIISTRDVIFDEFTFFKGEKEDRLEGLITKLDTLIEKVLVPKAQAKNEALLQEDDDILETDAEAEEAEVGGEAETENEPVKDFDQTQDLELAKALEEAYLSPPETDNENDESPCVLYIPYQCESTVTTDKFEPVSSEFREASRQAKEDRYADIYLEVITSVFHRAFTAGRKFRDKRLHQKNLPDKLKSLRDLENHPLWERFREAQLVYLESHRQMNSWVEANKKHVRGQKVISSMWTFIYKTDKHGFLQRCKA